MTLMKSLMLLAGPLLAVVSGCETAGPNPSREPADVVPLPLEDYTNAVGMEFKLIPSGEFMMGRSENKGNALDLGNTDPVHRVRITKPYFLGVTEVTQGQWEEVMGTRPWKGEADVKPDADHAVSYVSWDDAMEFCQKLSEKEGREYCLPTEAQWEYACRAGTTTRFSFGDDGSKLGSYAWYGRNAADVGEVYAHAVGSKRANPWGLHDMHGNVSEWCQDWYSENYESSPKDNPTGPPIGSHRVIRGGYWYTDARDCRSADRARNTPDFRRSTLGFRVILGRG